MEKSTNPIYASTASELSQKATSEPVVTSGSDPKKESGIKDSAQTFKAEYIPKENRSTYGTPNTEAKPKTSDLFKETVKGKANDFKAKLGKFIKSIKSEAIPPPETWEEMLSPEDNKADFDLDSENNADYSADHDKTSLGHVSDPKQEVKLPDRSLPQEMFGQDSLKEFTKSMKDMGILHDDFFTIAEFTETGPFSRRYLVTDVIYSNFTDYKNFTDQYVKLSGIVTSSGALPLCFTNKCFKIGTHIYYIITISSQTFASDNPIQLYTNMMLDMGYFKPPDVDYAFCTFIRCMDSDHIPNNYVSGKAGVQCAGVKTRGKFKATMTGEIYLSFPTPYQEIPFYFTQEFGPQLDMIHTIQGQRYQFISSKPGMMHPCADQFVLLYGEGYVAIGNHGLSYFNPHTNSLLYSPVQKCSSLSQDKIFEQIVLGNHPHADLLDYLQDGKVPSYVNPLNYYFKRFFISPVVWLGDWSLRNPNKTGYVSTFLMFLSAVFGLATFPFFAVFHTVVFLRRLWNFYRVQKVLHSKFQAVVNTLLCNHAALIFLILLPLLFIIWWRRSKFKVKQKHSKLFGVDVQTVLASADVASLIYSLKCLVESAFSLIGIKLPLDVIFTKDVMASLYHYSKAAVSATRLFAEPEKEAHANLFSTTSFDFGFLPSVSAADKWKADEFIALLKKHRVAIAAVSVTVVAAVTFWMWMNRKKEEPPRDNFIEALSLVVGEEHFSPQQAADAILSRDIRSRLDLALDFGLDIDEQHMKGKGKFNRNLRTDVGMQLSKKMYGSTAPELSRLRTNKKDAMPRLTNAQWQANREKDYVVSLVQQLKAKKAPEISFEDLVHGKYGVLQIIYKTKNGGYNVMTGKNWRKKFQKDNWLKAPSDDVSNWADNGSVAYQEVKDALEQGLEVYSRVFLEDTKDWDKFNRVIPGVEKHYNPQNVQAATFAIYTGRAEPVAHAVLVDTKLYTAAHVVDNLKTTLVELRSLDGKTSFSMSPHDFKPSTWGDIASSRFPSNVQPPKSLHLTKAGVRQVGFIYTTQNGKPFVKNTNVTFVGSKLDTSDIHHSCESATYGDSGSPIIDSAGHVIGIHTGRSGNVEVGQLIDVLGYDIDSNQAAQIWNERFARYEELKKNIEKHIAMPPTRVGTYETFPYPKEIDMTNRPFVDSPLLSEFFPEPNYEKVSNLPCVKKYNRKPKFVVDPVILQVSQSLGLLPSEPYGITRDTLKVVYKDFSKYNRDTHWNPKEDAVNLATSRLIKQFSLLADSGTYTYDEAVSILKKHKFPGAIWSSNYQTKGAVLASHDHWLRIQVQKFFDTGVLPDPIIGVCFKEEIRPEAKIKQDKVRSMCPVDIVIVIIEIMLYGKFIENFAKLPFTHNHSFVGYTMWYGGYDLFYRTMSECSEFRVRDQVKYDAHYCNQMREELTYFWQRMFSDPWHKRLIEVLENKMSNPLYVLPDGNVFKMKNGGEQSGRFWTLTNNCLRNIWSIYYTLIRHGVDPDLIDDNYHYFVMGDDDIIGLRKGAAYTMPSAAFWISTCYEINLDMDPISDAPDDLHEVLFCGVKYCKQIHDVHVFQPDIDKTLASLVVKKRAMTLEEQLSKLLALYQNALYTPFSTDIFSLVWGFYTRFCQHDQLAKNYWVAADPFNFHRYYIPILHVGATLNDTANKITLNNDTQLMQFHVKGNHCGPGYSNGKYQAFDPTIDPQFSDNTDAACYDHDRAYATPESDLLAADETLASKAYENGDYHISLGMAAQAFLRKLGLLDRFNSADYVTQFNMLTDVMPRLRGKNKGRKTAKAAKQITKAARAVARIAKEKSSAVGHVRLASAPRKVRARNRRRNRKIQKNTAISIAAPQGTSGYFINTKQHEKGIRVHVKMPLTNFTMSTSASDVNVVKGQFFVDPSLFTGSRVEYEALMYSRYNVRWRTMYHCTCPSTSSGSFFRYISMDPEYREELGNIIEDARIPQLKDFIDNPCYSGNNNYASPWAAKSGLYTAADRPVAIVQTAREEERFTVAGSIVFGILTPGATATLGGKLFIEAEFEFYDKSASSPILFAVGSGSSPQSIFNSQESPSSSAFWLGPLANTNDYQGFRIGDDFNTNAMNLFFRQPGTYFVSAWCTRTSATAALNFTGTACTVSSEFPSPDSGVASTLNGGTCFVTKSSGLDVSAHLNIAFGNTTSIIRLRVFRCTTLPSFALSSPSPFDGKEEISDADYFGKNPKKATTDDESVKKMIGPRLYSQYKSAVKLQPGLTLPAYLDELSASDVE